MTEAFLTLPFERVQTLLEQEYKGKPFSNTLFQQVKELYAANGIKEFYRGLTPIVLRNGISSPLYFGIKALSEDKKVPVIPANIQNNWFSFSGAAIGGIMSYFTFPLNLAKIHMQRKEKIGTKCVSIRGVFKELYKRRGCTSCKGCSYARYNMLGGAGMNSIRASIYWGITDAIYEYLSKKSPTV